MSRKRRRKSASIERVDKLREFSQWDAGVVVPDLYPEFLEEMRAAGNIHMLVASGGHPQLSIGGGPATIAGYSLFRTAQDTAGSVYFKRDCYEARAVTISGTAYEIVGPAKPKPHYFTQADFQAAVSNLGTVTCSGYYGGTKAF